MRASIIATAIILVAGPAYAGLGTTPCVSLLESSLLAEYGKAVGAAGDVNGDGLADVVVGAPELSNGESNEGRAYLYLGSPSGLQTLPNWSDESDQAGARFGFSVAGVGDVNGDGYDDVMVGAPQYDGAAADVGAAFLYLGGPSGLAATPAWSLEGGAASAKLGYSVAAAGDVNGDGYADVIIGVPGYANGQSGEGRALVFYGSASGLSLTPDWNAESDHASAEFGHAVASAGDVNGDGYDDVVVGAPWYSSFPGEAYVYHGGPTGLSATPARVLSSLDSGSRFGCSVAGAGDVNGDGYDDVVVGARLVAEVEGQEGGAFVYLGSASGLPSTAVWYTESNEVGAQLGYSVAGAGDLDGDGYDDILIGVPYLDPSGDGGAQIFFGGPSGPSPLPVITLYSPEANTQLGWSVAGVGDVDGDHDPDVVIGAPIRAGYRGAAFVFCGTSEAVCDIDSTTLDFGTVPVGASRDLSFTITNTGLGTLGGFVSEACGDFSILAGAGAYSLGAGEFVSVTVRFQPSTIGEHACTIETGQLLCGDVAVSGSGDEAGPGEPAMVSITDVGNDQGRQVRVTFSKSPRDTSPSSTPIVHYEVFRRIDPLPSALPQSGPWASADPERDTGMHPTIQMDGWDLIATVPAHGDPNYQFVAPTLADSTVAAGMYWSVFCVRAATQDPQVFFDSAPDSGYSLDNLVPSAPTGLALAGEVLSWDASAAEDFDYFTVYGSDHAALDGTADLIGTTTATQMAVGGHAFYHVSATDFSGNEGPAASLVATVGVSGEAALPAPALGQNQPNPFTAATQIGFVLPSASRIELSVYDVAGRLVRVLGEGAWPAGRHMIGWNGRDTQGRDVPAGIYLCRLDVGGVRLARTMLRLR